MDEVPIWLAEDCLRREGLPYERTDDETLTVLIEGTHANTTNRISVTTARLRMDTIYPFIASSVKRPLAAQYAARANCFLDVGTVTVDLEDGQVGFRSGLVFGREDPDQDLITAAIRYHLVQADRLVTGMAAVLFADVSPRIAFEQCLRHYRLDHAMGEADHRLRFG